ncbi:hypothetical protein GBC03_20625 [Citrobacter telavivensis]|uniref:Transposase n=1 Tax=Citrobacter telavivensis TaxID=2653932 RepID=A0A6L5E2Y2_9ENTR|nr:hypothetical protein [Citrobacter telavivensis]QFS72432.1 hypothetical protein GBC03_20625 [Citrobacter telavivensis]
MVTKVFLLWGAVHGSTDYIVEYYRSLRPHEYNGGVPSNESENRYWKNAKSVVSLVDHDRFAGA